MLMADLPYWKIDKTISKSVYVTRFVPFFLSCLAMYCNTHILLINRRYDFSKSVYFEIHVFCVFSSICFVKLYFWNCSYIVKKGGGNNDAVNSFCRLATAPAHGRDWSSRENRNFTSLLQILTSQKAKSADRFQQSRRWGYHL